MTRKPADPPPLRLVDIVMAVSVMTASVVIAGKSLEKGSEVPRFPVAVSTDGASAPIASEANVFRVRGAEPGVAPDFVADRAAHVRSLDMYRRLRAYPGAPPRVPHGLTSEEYRRSACNTCHERGGWVARFGTYAPVTPHPEYAGCLQCHLPQDDLVGRSLPAIGAMTCAQCHVDPDARLATFVGLDWRPAPWPETNLRAMPDGPHRIPHDFQTRANCLACHAGPGAVVGLRTDHPERVNCRQCHVPAGEGATPFPAPPAGADTGGEGGA